jgi:hypothetical protein
MTEESSTMSARTFFMSFNHSGCSHRPATAQGSRLGSFVVIGCVVKDFSGQL